ncbi:anthranilate synthase component I family protein [uncultured Croceitalea sp.]|uniref:anthranilate synthase component I family protein n=1 Tax=uncultured Croceitalea sp. TaxID=1798908 RepID=UPI0033063384
MHLRTTHTFLISNSAEFRTRLLIWAKKYEEAVFLDSNFHKDSYGTFDAVLAVDSNYSLSSNSNSFAKLKLAQEEKKDWLFGYFSYDLKNELESLESNNYDGLHFPELYFFQPKKIIILNGNKAQFLYLEGISYEAEEDFKAILELTTEVHLKPPKTNIKIRLRIHKDAYHNKANLFLKHIHRGDIYEANFCQEFYAEDTEIEPVSTYFNLNEISEPPFATFLKFDANYLLSATPERYLKKIGNKVISQPIKGTAARSDDAKEDVALKKNLKLDTKERAENIMITDLVRNDLSKFAKKGTVTVEELCEVYSFRQVHQMISTITALVDKEENSIDIIKATFPMGSMTGAPKIAAMKLIEDLEETKRGLYSGAVGYFTPTGDFDFNVIIRSILYNKTQKYVSYSVGSAITANSDPEKEYQECLLKAKAMRKVLESN